MMREPDDFDDAMARLLAPGQRIFVGASSNEPAGLLARLADVALPREPTFVQFPIGGLNATDFTALQPTARLTTFFMTPTLAKADTARVDFVPMQMRAVYDYLRRGIDVALLQVAYDADGVLRL